MSKPPESQHTTSAAIVRWYESKPQEHRPHMGASLIGHDCERFIWMTFRWALTPTFPGRVLRLFNTGVREEARLVEELRGIGATVWETDPDTGDQWRVSACNGHFGGSLDGVAQGLPEAPKTPAVLEFKTHSHKSFTDLIAQRLRKGKPQHFDQMTVYMGLMNLERGLYMAVNKDTDDVYTEWVHFDQERFDVLLEKAQRLIEATEPPAKLSEDPAHWGCKKYGKPCTFHAVCHGDKAAEPNCRTCCHATPVANAAWRCELHNKNLPGANQRAGCNAHLMIPALVPYGEPVDGGENWVGYRHRESGVLFTNGQAEVPGHGPNFASKELHHCPGELVADMASFKEQFPGARVVKPTPKSILDMESDDLDKVPTKPEHPVRKAARGRAAAALKALEGLK